VFRVIHLVVFSRYVVSACDALTAVILKRILTNSDLLTMPKPLRRSSVPKLKCFPWVSNKALRYVGMVEAIISMEPESIDGRQDRPDPVADHVQLPPSNIACR